MLYRYDICIVLDFTSSGSNHVPEVECNLDVVGTKHRLLEQLSLDAEVSFWVVYKPTNFKYRQTRAAIIHHLYASRSAFILPQTGQRRIYIGPLDRISPLLPVRFHVVSSFTSYLWTPIKHQKRLGGEGTNSTLIGGGGGGGTRAPNTFTCCTGGGTGSCGGGGNDFCGRFSRFRSIRRSLDCGRNSVEVDW